MRTTVVSLFATLLGVALIFSACSGSGSGGPQMGTPGWYWQAAQETFSVADYVKTEEHLDKLTDDENEWRKRAAVWRIVVLSGLARSYRELGDAYSRGAEANEAKASEFRNSIQQYQRDSRQYAIDLAESLPKYQKLLADDATIPFDFAFPAGSPNEAPHVSRLKDGEVLSDAQRFETERSEVKRGVLLQATLLSGAGEDVNAARTQFSSGSVEVPREIFLNGLGRTLWIVSASFDRTHLNQPDIEKILVTHALKSIESTLESDDEEIKKQAETLKEEIEEKKEQDEKVRKRLRG